MATNIQPLVESIQDPVIAVDADFVVQFASQTFADVFGYTSTAVQGKHLSFLLPTITPENPPTHHTIVLARHASTTTASMVCAIQTMRDPTASLLMLVVTPLQLPPTYSFSFRASTSSALSPKLSINEVNFRNRRVIVRVDFNVPIDAVTGLVRDDNRILATLPTIKKILEDGAKSIVLMSHLGRPKKDVQDVVDEWTKAYHAVSGGVGGVDAATPMIMSGAGGSRPLTTATATNGNGAPNATSGAAASSAGAADVPPMKASASVQQSMKKYSLVAVAERLAQLLGRQVVFAPNALTALKCIKNAKPGTELILLENLRFHSGEDAKTLTERTKMAQILSSYGEIFVCDAFGTAHRESASMTGIPRLLGAGVAGYLIEKEVNFMNRVLFNPPTPFLAIIGGSKVSDKISLFGNIFSLASTVIVGGAMAFTFLEALGCSSGSSRVERSAKVKARDVDLILVAKELIERARSMHVELLLPIDHVCSKKFENIVEPLLDATFPLPGEVAKRAAAAAAAAAATAEGGSGSAPVKTPTTAATPTGPQMKLGVPTASGLLVTQGRDIPEGYMGLDAGPKTIELWTKAVARAKTLVWNGPVGVFEFPIFSRGTTALAQAVQPPSRCLSLVGGGDTAAAVKSYASRFSHVSTGGGATLELLEGKALPGLVCLTSKAPVVGNNATPGSGNAAAGGNTATSKL